MTLLVSGGGHGFPIIDGIDSLLTAGGGEKLLKIGTPYLSAAGLEVLSNGFEAFTSTSKMWLIGVHHGVTEPAALRALLTMTHSEARIFTVHGALSARELSARPIFHAKVVGVENTSGRKPSLEGILVSSANLTGAALGRSSFGANYEAGATLVVSTLAEKRNWAAWWKAAWDKGLTLDSDFINHYERLRNRFLSENKIVLDLVDPPSTTLLSSAPTLWIEAGAMSGGSRNQVEFNRDLAEFFGPPSTSTRILTMQVGKRVWNDRPLSPKTTSFGVDIWRLSLPTEAKGGFNYPGKVIRLQRDPSAGGTFHLSVAPSGSSRVRNWRSTAGRDGYIGRTSGNREFGLY